MTDLVDYVGALIRLAGGQIVGKTRLQKIAYLLEAKDIGFGLDFDYHNYGPFSSELAFAIDDAKSLGYVQTEERPGFHSVPYTVFNSTAEAPEFEDSEVTRDRKIALEVVSGYSAIDLELAATAVYFKTHGYPDTFWHEVKRRKPLKAKSDRVAAAKKLISDLGLSRK